MLDVVINIAPYAVAYMIPLMLTALGGLYSERSGIINIGLEGIMVFGCFISAVMVHFFAPSMGVAAASWLGVLAALVVGTLCSVLHAFASINLNADQTISGTAINMIAGALTMYLARQFTGSGIIVINSMTRIDVPVLSKIPVIGTLLFSNAYPTTWAALALLLLSWFAIMKTPFGLRLRSCGEFPEAAEAAGVSVFKMRYIGVLLSGAMAGLGGGIYTVTIAGQFSGSVGGLGFLALAALIFGQWKPFGVLGATFLFGLALTVSKVSQVVPQFNEIPSILLKIAPYVITLLALVIFSKRSRAPKAEGEHFEYKRRSKVEKTAKQ